MLDRCEMAASFQFQVVFLFLLGVFLVLSAEGRVIELDDSFRELKKNGYWFVEFYAPWCGHCKNLEPIWREVGEELSKSNTIVTAKLDCTVYRDLAEEMGVHGFPTIKFFRGKFSATYQGSRTKKELVEFALKASRPILTELKTTKEFERRQTKADVFFLFVRNNEKISEEYEEVIREVAESKIAHAVFYSIKDTILPKDVKVDKVPGLIVIKDNVILAYEDEGEALNKSSISSWVDREKFLPFLIVTESNVDALADTGKMIVFATFAKESEKKKRNLRLGEVVKEMSLDLKSRFSKKFQFAGVFQRDIIESIMMGTAEYPFILVLNPHSRVYYILHSSAISESFSAEELTAFLDDVLNGKATAHGGRTFSQRMWRIWWDIRGSAKDIWRASPFMAIVIFGLPCLVFTFLIVMLCCLEAAPDNEEYEEHMEERGERGDERDTDGEALASSTTYNRLKSD